MIPVFTKLTLAACLLIASLSAWAVCDTGLLKDRKIEYQGNGGGSIYAASINQDIAKALKKFTITGNVGLDPGEHTLGAGDDLVTVTVSEDGKSADVECASLPDVCGDISITYEKNIKVSANCSEAHQNLKDLIYNKKIDSNNN